MDKILIFFILFSHINDVFLIDNQYYAIAFGFIAENSSLFPLVG